MEFVEIDDDDVKAFLVESYESINQIERDIIELEKSAKNGEILVRIYRSVHNIKGNCGFLPFPKLESVAHASENLLGYLRDRQLVISSEITTALLQTVDTIRQILAQIEAEGNEGEGDYSTLIQTLTVLQEKEKQIVSAGPKPLEPIAGLNGTAQLSAQQPPQSELAVSESSIRVDVNLLDRMMNLVGELVLVRNQLLEFAKAEDDSPFAATCQRLNLIATQLQAEVMTTRMQPISTIWQKFPRVVRDLAIAYGKQVRVEMEGYQTELDRSMIEAIKDPLTHIVRNCIDHGIETPAERSARGKPGEGLLSLRAWHESGKVNIEIRDDGGGIDPERLKQKAQQLKLMTAKQAAAMSESEAINLIFLPGFSTAEQITNLSGRGVGMDVVKNNIEQIDGTVEVQSQLNWGTRFKLKIPLTLAIIPALIVTSGGDRYAIAQASLQELVRLEGEQAINGIETLYDVPVYRLRGNLLPLIYLNRELQIQETATNEEIVNIVVIQADDYQFGLVVDKIEDTQEIVVKPLGKQLRLSVFAGATILGDGKVALIIDAIALAARAGVNAQTRKQLSDYTVTKAQEQRQMVLLFEGPQGAPMGIPLSLACRLEKFPRAAALKVGNQYVVQYRDTVLSLVDLHDVFSDGDRDFSCFNQALTTEDDMLEVVVVSLDRKHSIGLVLDRILDIVEEQLTIKGIASRPGVLFYAVIQGQVIEMLDVEYAIREVNPYFLELSGCGVSSQ